MSGLIEGYGTGVLRIRKYIEENCLPQPEFKDYNGFFKAIFYGAGKEVEKISDREVEREVEIITDNQKMILEMIGINPFVSKKEMSETVGIRSSSIDKNITTLKEKGHLKRVGPAKGGHWEIIK